MDRMRKTNMPVLEHCIDRVSSASLNKNLVTSARADNFRGRRLLFVGTPRCAEARKGTKVSADVQLDRNVRHAHTNCCLFYFSSSVCMRAWPLSLSSFFGSCSCCFSLTLKELICLRRFTARSYTWTFACTKQTKKMRGKVKGGKHHLILKPCVSRFPLV
ncbi:hypothetical protein TGARI_371060 [Toxoplasma gondii ARI]|uniref:Uncharacterized protein n=1 Tax=Toxoplasma gondii ARI TaxID=1074872 RepID=A0A139XR48_TOXGO|nr:hypothetical protein TGARI_371060 [Toxoplasma gondii ARI]